MAAFYHDIDGAFGLGIDEMEGALGQANRIAEIQAESMK